MPCEDAQGNAQHTSPACLVCLPVRHQHLSHAGAANVFCLVCLHSMLQLTGHAMQEPQLQQ